ncbi:DUF5915 domain-containing protein [Haloarcula sp. CBA1127]|uniref:DUF5915 domain-containing protein n=1 Tax=Haloarcula sp. CBA1127 TaxID=1765055 RepID=UPI00073F8487|nr:DUF5915 domain-containing protein [Haloarcula sp. CBA1127]
MKKVAAEMRKDLELDIEARIVVDLAIDDKRVDSLVREHEALIKEEVRADELSGVEDGHRKTWDVEGTDMEIAIAPCEADQREASEQAGGD